MGQIVNVNFKLDSDIKKAWRKHALKWDSQ